MNSVYGLRPPEQTMGFFAPGGRLTLVTGTPVITSDQASKTVVYYTPFTHAAIPIIRGGIVRPAYFTDDDLQLTLTSAHTLSSHFDVFAVMVGDRVRLMTGVAWGTITAGAGARGSGGGTTELTRAAGMLVNKYPMPGLNGDGPTFIDAMQGTYLGSLCIDGTAGQITCHRSWGQSRKWGVWNAYNRQPIILRCGDSTASWTYATASYRAANNSTSNKLTVFTGLAEEAFELERLQQSQGSANDRGGVGAIGWNSTTVASGSEMYGQTQDSVVAVRTYGITNRYVASPALGINDVTALEKALSTSATNTFIGTEAGMLLAAVYRG